MSPGLSRDDTLLNLAEAAAFLRASRAKVYREAVFDGKLSASGRPRVLIQVLARAVPTIVHTSYLRRAS